jgi:hypothetical protein
MNIYFILITCNVIRDDTASFMTAMNRPDDSRKISS